MNMMIDTTTVVLTKVAIGDCKAKNEIGGRCILDAVHRSLGTSHLYRDADGHLVSWKEESEENQ